MDPRAMHGVEIGSTLGFVGGAAGIGAATGAALAANEQDFFGQVTTGELSRAIGNISASHGYQLLGHFGCAFIAKAPEIIEQARDVDFAVAAVQKLDPSQPADLIARIATGYGRLLDTGAVTEQDITYKDLTKSSHSLGAPVALQTPDHDSHNSEDILLSDEELLALLPEVARAAEREAYYHNNGGSLTAVHKRIHNEVPVDLATLITSGLTLITATHSVLERVTGHTIDIIRV